MKINFTSEFEQVTELHLHKYAIPINILSFISIVPFFNFYVYCLSLIRPEIESHSFVVRGAEVFLAIGIFLGISVFVIILHELVHGVFFWVISGQKPVFGLRVLYAFASAPGIPFSKIQFQIIVLAPLIILSGLGIVALYLFPETLLLVTLLAMLLNASGAIGDIILSIWILFMPRGCIIVDNGDVMQFYKPRNSPGLTSR